MYVPKFDPYAEQQGALPRSCVLDCLYRHQVDVTHDGIDGIVIFSCGSLSALTNLPPLVGRAMIKMLSTELQIPLTEFHYPPSELN